MNEQPPAQTTHNRRLAAIDVGSNSIRLLIAEVSPDGTYRVLDDEKQTTRLARGLSKNGALTQEAIDLSLETLGRMKVIAQGYNVERLEIIATSAVREAANREDFLRRARDRLGLEIEVISAQEEGQLSFASVARHFDLKATNAAVMDLGGGSAELVLVANGVVQAIHSLPLGAVRLTEAFVKSDPISERDSRRLVKHIRKSFQAMVGGSAFTPQVLIGAGGTFMALANISMRRRGSVYTSVGGYEMNRGEVRHILENLKDLPLSGRRAVPGLHADRADIILAGVTVIDRMMKLLHVNRVLIHDQGVRDGLMLRMIARLFPVHAAANGEDADPLAGVRQFASACAVEPKHAEHVAKLARALFEQLRTSLPLSPDEGTILEAAALLHEVGYLINYEKHHQHSYHLILHGNLRGLTPRQRELVANVARYHRRSGPKLKHDNFVRLAPAERETVRRLSAILRVADGLDRTHTQQIQGLRCQWRDDRVRIAVLANAAPEVDLWGARQKGKLFEKVFSVKLKFVWQPPEPVCSSVIPAVFPEGREATAEPGRGRYHSG